MRMRESKMEREITNMGKRRTNKVVFTFSPTSKSTLLHVKDGTTVRVLQLINGTPTGWLDDEMVFANPSSNVNNIMEWEINTGQKFPKCVKCGALYADFNTLKCSYCASGLQ